MGLDLCTRNHSLSITGSGVEFLGNVLHGLELLDTTADGPPGSAFVWPPEGADSDLADEILERCDDWREAGEAYVIEDLPGTPSERERIVNAVHNFHEYLSWRPPSGKVPAFKFGSNDGWIVTANEIQLVADALREALPTLKMELSKAGQTELVSVLDEFATLLEYAKRHGEFRVF